ncbi:MAG: hypothetical protein KBT02_08070 [Treponema sp.]|nr:hypothetical protein [Candidatus Treponema caballi]
MKNVGEVERAWLPSAVSSPLKTNLKLFTGMVSVNFENTAKIQEIQKKVESGAYDASNAIIEAGKLQDADYGVFTTITKTGNSYQLAISITNLTTGREEATATISNIIKETDLQDSAINAAIIQLAPQLGVELTVLGLYTLSSSSDASLAEQISLASQEAASYQATIDALNKQLADFNNANALTDQEILAQKAAVEADKQLFEQRQIAARQKAQRLQEQKKKADEEAMAAKARSSEATKKLGELSSQAEEIAAQVRTKQLQLLSAEERVTLIENKKAAYMRIYNQVSAEIASARTKAENEYQEGYKDPENPDNYVSGTYSNGKFDPVYHQMLVDGNEQLRKEIDLETDTYIANLYSSTNPILESLLEEIKEDLASLSKTTFTLSSLAHPEIFNISSYNVESHSWTTDISLTLFNKMQVIKTQEFSYKLITGEHLPSTIEEYNDYAATYDIYDAMFRMNVPFLTFEIDYVIEPDSDNHPSSYFVVPLSYRLIRTSDNTIIDNQNLPDNPLSVQYALPTDMQILDQPLTQNERRTKEEKAQQEEREKKERALALDMQPNIASGPWGAFTMSQGAGEGIGFEAGLWSDNKASCFNTYLSSLPVESTNLILISSDLYIDKRINLIWKKFFVSYGGGIGIAFTPLKMGTIMVNDDELYTFSKSSSDLKIGFTYSGTVAFHIPLAEKLTLFGKYTLRAIKFHERFWYDTFSIGIIL